MFYNIGPIYIFPFRNLFINQFEWDATGFYDCNQGTLIEGEEGLVQLTSLYSLNHLLLIMPSLSKSGTSDNLLL